MGDQILDVNGKCFLNISHEEAVRVLKSSQQLVIMLKDIGILPHGKRVYDETRWIRDTETANTSRFDKNTYTYAVFDVSFASLSQIKAINSTKFKSSSTNALSRFGIVKKFSRGNFEPVVLHPSVHALLETLCNFSSSVFLLAHAVFLSLLCTVF